MTCLWGLEVCCRGLVSGQWCQAGLQAFQVESCLHTACPDHPADKTCLFGGGSKGGGLASEAFVTITESVWLHVLLGFPAGAAVPGAVLSGPSRHSPRGSVSRIRPAQDRNPEAPWERPSANTALCLSASTPGGWHDGVRGSIVFHPSFRMSCVISKRCQG